MLNPLFARELAIPNPIPLSDPVTTATLFDDLYILKNTFKQWDDFLKMPIFPYILTNYDVNKNLL